MIIDKAIIFGKRFEKEIIKNSGSDNFHHEEHEGRKDRITG
jgi:hypothetical protein